MESEDRATAPVRSHQHDAMSKHWCFTLNNYTVEEENYLRDEGANVEYLIFGKEIGDNGTPHLQGYVVFINRKRMTAVKKWLKRAHWEIKRGSPLEASNYCRKEDQTPFESGNIYRWNYYYYMKQIINNERLNYINTGHYSDDWYFHFGNESPLKFKING